MTKGKGGKDCGCGDSGLRPWFCKPSLNTFVSAATENSWKTVGEEVWFKVGMCICLLDSLTGGFTSLRLEQFQLFHFCFARELISAILKVALLTDFYKLICGYLSHPSSRFITPLVSTQPPLFPRYRHVNTTGLFSPLNKLTDICFILEFDTRIAKWPLKLRQEESI